MPRVHHTDKAFRLGSTAFHRARHIRLVTAPRPRSVDAMLGIPPAVRAKAQLAGATGWLDGLPALVASLESDWGISAGRPYEDGTEAYVAAAVTADGQPAVLKLLVPRAGNDAAREIAVLRLTAGEGCVRLLRDDVSRGALLLERLGPSLYDLALPIGRRHEVLVDAVRRVWRPTAEPFPTGAEKGVWLIEHITATWEALDRPVPRRTIQHALDCARRRIDAHRDDRAVLVHGDVHQWNALAAGDGTFKLIDPDGLRAEAEYDLGVIMREDPVELLDGDPFDRARWLAARTGLDATAIWEWGVVERVSTGLLCAAIDLQPVGQEMLTAANRIAEQS